MDDTGRILRPLTPSARRIVFGSPGAGHERRTARSGAGAPLSGGAWGEAEGRLGPQAGRRSRQKHSPSELEAATTVDRAHLVMLAEEGLIARGPAVELLDEIAALRADGFAALATQEARRGLYLLYEDALVSRLGAGTGGLLRTARSRNDLNATVFLIRLRLPWQRLMTELSRLQAVLLRGARRHGDVLMPAYTHHQAALPSTFGHYLAGVATALDRDLEGCWSAGAGLERCPLGAGAGGGATLPIDPGRTAALLGFSSPVAHSTDAVASREPALRLLAAAAVTGVTLSRLTSDLTAWTTAEFGFLHLDDDLVGSSSLMPQKRNPFLLEHAKGRAAAPLGAFVAAATAAHATPFANSVAVGAEATAPLHGALDATADAACLLRLVLAGARPDRAAMAERARNGSVTATYAAETLAAAAGLSYGEAHRLVGAALSGRGGLSGDGGAALNLPSLAEALSASRFGGGPGRPAPMAEARGRRAVLVAGLAARARRWETASTALDEACADLGARAVAVVAR